MEKIYWLLGFMLFLTFSACDKEDDQNVAPTQNPKPSPSPSQPPPGYYDND